MPHIDPTQWIADYGYLAVFLIVFMETAGVPLPGEITLILAGVAAHRGNLDLPLVIVIGATAAIIGDNVGYVIGRYGGRRVVLRLAHYGRVDSMLGWGERFFASHGGKTVFLARWTAGLRIFGAWIAGMTHMPWRTFFIWNAAGGITWATAAVTAGYVFSGSVARIESVFGKGGAILAGIALVGGAAYGLRLLHHRQAVAREAEMAAAGDDGTPGTPAGSGGGGEADVAAGDDGPVDDREVHGVIGDGGRRQADVGEGPLDPP
jgi:membrane protein DedA with SNARE-associated domain